MELSALWACQSLVRAVPRPDWPDWPGWVNAWPVGPLGPNSLQSPTHLNALPYVSDRQSLGCATNSNSNSANDLCYLLFRDRT